MPDSDTPMFDRIPGEPGGPADLPDGGYTIPGGPLSQSEPHGDEYRIGEGVDQVRVSDSGRIMFEPAGDTEPERDRCPVCRGTGWKMTTADFLRESLTLVEGRVGEVVELFYERLFTVAPHLEPLFPDMVGQRDRLVGALGALATSYDPTNGPAMDALRTTVAAMGRAHSNFRRPDGTEQGATLDEYMAVKSILLPTLAEVAGGKWLPVYTSAWSEAYDFAASHMMVAAFAAPQRFARSVRA